MGSWDRRRTKENTGVRVLQNAGASEMGENYDKEAFKTASDNQESNPSHDEDR